MPNSSTPLLAFVAASGTGKTTLLTQLIPLLSEQGLRIAVIKRSHHDVEIDKPQKDSFKLRAAGAVTTMLSSPYRRAIISEHKSLQQLCLQEELQHLTTPVNLILVEGFKQENIAKIELHRTELNKDLLYPSDTNIIAVASNTLLTLPQHLVLLDINNPKQIAHFITATFLKTYV